MGFVLVLVYAFPFFPPAIANADLLYLEELCSCLLRSLAAVASPKSLQRGMNCSCFEPEPFLSPDGGVKGWSCCLPS